VSISVTAIEAARTGSGTASGTAASCKGLCLVTLALGVPGNRGKQVPGDCRKRVPIDSGSLNRAYGSSERDDWTSATPIQ
jgi:hypothetical protein